VGFFGFFGGFFWVGILMPTLVLWDLLWMLQSFSCGLLNPVKVPNGPTGQIR
jgi:hypothetical protein